MAKDLITTTANSVATMLSSPVLVRLRKISLGTIERPGEAPTKYLSAGQTLTSEDRAEAEGQLRMLRAIVEPGRTSDKLAIVGKLLLAYPAPGASAASGQARGEAYLEALSDIPAWAIAAAVTRWHRGECGDYDYAWAPAPAILRRISEKSVAPVVECCQRIEVLLAAKPLDEIMQDRTSLPI